MVVFCRQSRQFGASADEQNWQAKEGVSMSYLPTFAGILIFFILAVIFGAVFNKMLEKYKKTLLDQYDALIQKKKERQDEVLKDGEKKD